MSPAAFANGRYRVERPLAEGGMADVYLASDTALERRVAVKLLAESLAADESLRERFAREARMAAALQHPNIVTVFDTGEEGARPYIVMELVEGTTLAERIRVERRLAPDEVVEIGVQACAGLAAAHAAGLVHRDVKPGNVLLRADGVVKIADFGIASAAQLTSVTEVGTILGTAAYLAPEQAMGEPATPATDVYGLGAVLYEALTGRPPFRFESLPQLVAMQQEGAVRPVGDLAPNVPPALETAVMRCLATDPQARPGSVAEVSRLLEAASGVGTEPVDTQALTQPMRRPERASAARRRRPRRGADPRLLAAALVTVLTLGGIAAGVALTRDGGEQEPAVVEPVPQGESPAEQARNLSTWLRDHAEPAQR